ncbi:hypothetical protein OBBRIDRAFT_890735, partial [Obba rivulosa]
MPGGGEDSTGLRVFEGANLRSLFETRICLVACDTIVLFVTWSATYELRKTAGRSDIRVPLMKILLRDGTLHFVLLLALNMLQMALWATNTFTYVVIDFVIPFSSVIISRFLLKRREAAHRSPISFFYFDTSLWNALDSQSSMSGFTSFDFLSNMGGLVDFVSDYVHEEDHCDILKRLGRASEVIDLSQ